MDIKEIWTIISGWLLSHGLRILLILVLTFAAMKIARLVADRAFAFLRKTDLELEMQKRADTLKSLLRYLLHTVILAVSLVMILGEFGVQIGPVIAAAGIVGLAVGFGAQHLVSDVIGGFFILLEDQIRVGDVVQVAGKSGLVERVNLRTVTLRDLAGNVHYIRNGQIDTVTNMTKEYSHYVFNIGVAYREDVDEVMDVIRQVGEEMQNDPEYGKEILEPVEVLGLDEFADSAIIIKARVKTVPIKQWRVGREFNRRLKIQFDKLNIEIPFPHMTLYMGEGKDGSAPSVKVAMVDKKRE